MYIVPVKLGTENKARIRTTAGAQKKKKSEQLPNQYVYILYVLGTWILMSIRVLIYTLN